VPRVTLAAPLVRLLPGSPPGERTFVVAGATVREALDAVLAEAPVLRGYLLDERGALRHHVAAFVDGVVVRDKAGLGEAVGPDGEVFLVPALSGG